MNSNKHITGIILAGGKSQRMGKDKALLPFRGKTFLEHIIDALKPLVNNILIVSDHKKYDVFGETRVDDLIKNAGPLAGLYSGLYHSKTEDNIIVSCDVPLIDITILERLIDENNSSWDVVQLQSGDKTMPLIARYKKKCMDACLKSLQSGERRLQAFVDQQKTKTLLVGKNIEHQLVNINTKTDLKELKNGFDY